MSPRVARGPPRLLNTRVTEPVRRQLEQPSDEKTRRTGCLMWGGVLGVLVGIMVGIYALPPILKHYFGETVVAHDGTYIGGGRELRLDGVILTTPEGEPGPGMRIEAFEAIVIGVAEEDWIIPRDHFTLEFEELDDWQPAIALNAQTGLTELHFSAGVVAQFGLRFEVEVPADQAGSLTVEALHLSDPRVKFEVAPP